MSAMVDIKDGMRAGNATYHSGCILVVWGFVEEEGGFQGMRL